MKMSDCAIRAFAGIFAAKFHLLPELVYAVIMEESSGDPTAENPSDPSAGLMQVMPANGRKYSALEGDDAAILRALKDPETNLTAGCGYLSHLAGLLGSRFPVTEWVQAYNVGAQGFLNGRRNPAYGAAIEKYMQQWHGSPTKGI